MKFEVFKDMISQDGHSNNLTMNKLCQELGNTDHCLKFVQSNLLKKSKRALRLVCDIFLNVCDIFLNVLKLT